ncbi:peptidoglycan-associated lipoprotein Pal [Bosea sp. CCNWLW174]|jgi:peptidoglycan-associated lipoprotein|uniref:peptidoglycan-associated lipoprotein Pal n=1 Tax=unclassified Bosea (in: a-proteobacteria) TaxID=2653178 RepID=UPI00301533CC
MLASFAASARTVRIAAALIGALALGACAKDQNAADGFGAGGAATPGSAQDFVVNVGDRVFFETDSTDLTPTAVATLDKQSSWLQRYPRYTFTIEGHADERGTREYNYSLGARRAQTVRDYLASRGIPSNRIRTISYGKERPVAVCNDISCWSQNRRAVTVLDGAGGV